MTTQANNVLTYFARMFQTAASAFEANPSADNWYRLLLTALALQRVRRATVDQLAWLHNRFPQREWQLRLFELLEINPAEVLHNNGLGD